MDRIKKFFHLEESGTTISKELVAGATTFFAMVYIIFVNPDILGKTGMPVGAVFLATIIATIVGTLFMALFANVPYALAPGMGLNAFFTYTVCFSLGFSWQEALAIVFICGIINIIITVTKVRKSIIRAIPKYLQSAIGGGIGLFIAYIGIKNSGLLSFVADPGHWFDAGGTAIIDSSIVPELTKFETAIPILASIGLIITSILMIKKVKGSILIGIVVTTLLGIPMGVTQIGNLAFDYATPFKELGTTFFAAFKAMPSLFSDWSRIPMALLAIFAFSLSDTFDTIGTFIGTGRVSGIFDDKDMDAIENSKGFNTKMERALFADSIATSIGALIGTSNTTTYVESAAGIGAGGRTGLTSVFTSILFALSILLAPVVGIVPSAATAPALIIVGILMASSLKEVDWADLDEAIPSFLTVTLMTLAYNISIGIAFGFIYLVIVKLVKNKVKEIHPIIWFSAILFLAYFVLMALKARAII
jgi:AGZA family xanthine/uracil permease-like MFS transporter